jgi:alanine dehydrogenase
MNACVIAVGMGGDVTLLARRSEELRRVKQAWPDRLSAALLSPDTIGRAIDGADLLISGVLVPGGAAAPKLLSRGDLRAIGPGAVVVDVSIDQGGMLETSRPTRHADPVYVEEGVVHYCVANMPGAVPRTATGALTAATLPYVLELAERGVEQALSSDPALAKGLMTRDGELVNPAVAR